MTDDIFRHFGLSNQVDKLFEEYREVLMAFLHGTDGDIREELADLGNLVNQLTDYYGRVEIEKIQHEKNLRTLQRIEGGYYE
jgi:NTP pyrophosphatase (non-canonical NTP hydrolase)